MLSNSKPSLLVKSLIFQYLVGVLINCLYLLILMINNTSYQNLQLPEGSYSENLWKGSDVLTYVRPARNFLHYGIFGSGTIPDYHRTIGYPFFLSILMALFGTHWLIGAFFVQAMLFAVMYPLLSRVAVILFNSDSNVIMASFLFFIFSGTYIVRVPLILTDTFFTVFFTVGLWLGLEAIVRKSYKYLLWHIIFIGYAAQIRPLLSIYAVVDCLLLIFVSKKYYTSFFPNLKKIIIISFVILSILCNIPSARNYIHYGFFKPTDILSSNLFSQLGKDVLTNVGKVDEYKEMQKATQNIKNIREKMRLQEELAKEIYTCYPLATLRELLHNMIGILGRSHWSLVANFWGYNFKDDFSHRQTKLTHVFYLEIFFSLVYLIVYIFFLSFLVRNFRRGNFLLILAICFLIAYLLAPTFMIRGAGSRMRLPAEGLIVTMALCELIVFLKAMPSLKVRVPS